MIATLDQFDRIRSIPIHTPQTELVHNDVLVLATLDLRSGDELEVKWLSLELLRTKPSVRSSGILRAAKSGTAVTTQLPFFTADDVGAIIRWTGLVHEVIVSAYVSPTQVTVTDVGGSVPSTITLGFFSLTPLNPTRVNDAYDVVYAGLYTQDFYKVGVPTGHPLMMRTLNAPGLTVNDPMQSNVLFGPLTISVVVVNNTLNFDAEVSVVGMMRHTIEG